MLVPSLHLAIMYVFSPQPTSLSAILHLTTSGVKLADFAELCAALVLENISTCGKKRGRLKYH